MCGALVNVENDPTKAWEEMKKQISLQQAQHKLQGKGQLNGVRKTDLELVDPSGSYLPSLIVFV